MIAARCSWLRHYAAIEITRTPGDQEDPITFPAHKEEAMQSQPASIRTSSVHENDNEQHVRAIDRLVHELGVPAEEVNKSYREILDEFRKDVKVEVFLPNLVSWAVQARLQQT
jgi:isopentenyldiphosphate isomerase